MEHQNTAPNEPQNDIYELLKKVVETNEENIKSTKQVESVHREAQNFYQTAQNAIIGSTNMMQKAIQFVRTELESIIGFKTSIPESIPADLSENTVNFFEKIEKHIKGKYCSITINGSNTVGLSESYADEVFGKLAKKLGKKRFFEVFSFVGFSELDLGVIATALQKRLR